MHKNEHENARSHEALETGTVKKIEAKLIN